MRKVVPLLALFLFAGSARAQKCELSLEQAPVLRGFKLGMRLAQARGLLAGVPLPKPDDLGIQRVRVSANVLRKSDPSSSSDVRQGKLLFLDGKLMSVEVVYGDADQWEGVDDFIFRVSQSLGLPPMWPKRVPVGPYDDLGERWRSEKGLRCDGFSLWASLERDEGVSKLHLFDSALEDKIEERRRALIEKKKEAFKP